MAITYQTTLPDPNNSIGNAGQNTGLEDQHVGYKSVKLSSKSQIMKNRTNSGRLITRSHGSHTWNINITYNPMTRAEFEPIYNFLLNRRGGLDPFYVSLPQYRVPQDSTFAAYALADLTRIVVDESSGVAAGATKFKIDGVLEAHVISPGDLFTITDGSDSSHTKAYRITQVETNAAGTFESAPPPAVDERIIHFVPGLAKSVTNDAQMNFHNPLIRVILSNDVQEYSLGVDGLYQFSLNLEEAQP